jgi:hypothetical protein
LQEEFFEKINELHKSDISDEKKAVLASLADYGKTITEGL